MKTFSWLKTLFLSGLLATSVWAQSPPELTIVNTSFQWKGKPFPWTGISFFNAIYNPSFNKSSADRVQWMQKFQRYGINVLRIWGQWDTKRGYVDTCETCTLYFPDGRLREPHMAQLKAILADADKQGMVVELALFALESWGDNIRLSPEASDKAVAALTKELLPYRNLTLQIWNEFNERVPESVKIIKAIDPKRLVSNSPSVRFVPTITSSFGEDAHNRILDYLTPHTLRQGGEGRRHWEVAPMEIAYLLKRYRKPVVDDEPARNGTPDFGGPKVPTNPYDHILQIYQVWQMGGYILYHHDMFQTGYGTPAVPPSGIPDPEFNPYHKAVLDFIAKRERYQPQH
jgi:hypothetical protein